MSTLLQDVRHAIRALGRSPGFTLVAIVTLAVGIGLTTAVFSVVNAVLVRPLPYADSERIVVVWETLRDLTRGSASPGHFFDWTGQATVFEATAARDGATYNLADGGEPERIRGERVTSDYFRVAYVPPLLGRYFSDQDNAAGQPLVVLSQGLWETRFGGDRAIIGRTIRLSGTPYTVIGVAPASYALTDPARAGVVGGFSAQAWTLLTFTPEQRASYGSHYLMVLGKLRPGVSREAAQADVERVTRGIAERHPENMAARGVNLQLYEPVLVGDVRLRLLVLLGAVGLVLLIACVNIAGLLLARAVARRREMAIRASLGGGPARIIRQLITESATLAIAGGVLSLAVAYPVVRFLVENGGPGIPRLAEAGLQPTVLLFAVALSALAAVFFGLAPAVRAARTDLRSGLHPSRPLSASGAARDRVRSAMVVGQIGITAVLLVATGLLVRSALRLQQVSFGFNAENVVTAQLALPAGRYGEPATVTTAYTRMLEEIRAIQGVSAAGASTNLPLGDGNADATIMAEGKTYANGEAPSPNVRLVTDGYFQAVGMRIVRGRPLETADMAPGAARVMVINETLADLIWPGENAVGKRISAWTVGPEPEWREVVGVVGDVRSFGRDEDVQPEMFWPYTQEPFGAWDVWQRSMVFVIRTAFYPETYTANIRRAVWTVDPTLPLFNVRTLESVVVASTATGRFYLRLIMLLAVTGLGLAGLGLYGVIAYFVSQRRSEIGVRMALGAERAGVVRMVIRHSLATALAGIMIGLGAALALTRVMAGLLYEVEPTDPQTFVVAGVVLVATALAAAWLPARRAAGVDPAIALRAD